MVCPHCGETSAVAAGRCTSCNRIVDRKAPVVAAGLLTPVPVLFSGIEMDETRRADGTGPQDPVRPPDESAVSAASAGPADFDPEASTIRISAADPVSPTKTGLGRTAFQEISGPLATGQTFGSRYHIIRLLGAGGMGAVYQAWDEELGVAVAIKVIRPEVASDPATAAELQRRFKRELLLARQVTHRNVVRIHDLGEIDGIKYLTMPFIQGQDLATVLRTSGRLPVPTAINLTRQVVAGLQAAHEAGVVHRDLKPANIMVEDERAVIMDFGIARAAEGGGSTVLGMVVGTLEYMAPEQARAETVDHRADLYAVGLILYDMLVGRRHAGRPDSVVAGLMARMQHAPPSLRSIDPEIPELVDRIVMRCVQPDPADRYQTAAELLVDLDALVEPQGGRTISRPAFGRRAGFPRWSWQAWAAAASIVIALLAAGMWLARDRTGSAPPARVAAGPMKIAVLPFRNASGDPSLDWVAASFAEMLRTELGQSSYLHAVPSDRVHQILQDLRLSSQSSFNPGQLAQLAELSSADSVLWGQYVRFGPEIRVSATLENVKERRNVELAASAPTEAALLSAITQIADKIRETVTTSPDILKELRDSAFKPSTQSVQALRFYTEGLTLSRQGQHAQALKQIEAAVAADGRFALAYSRQAQIYQRLNREEDAQQASRTAVGLAQDLPPREKYLVEAAHARVIGDNRKAIEAYGNLSKVTPDDSEVDFALASLYEATGAYEKAHEHLSKVLARDPKYLDALILMGRVEIRRTKYQPALEHLNAAYNLAAQFDNAEAKADALHSQGVLYRRLTKYDEALRKYEEALEIKRGLGEKSSIATTVNEIGHALNQSGKPDEAIKSYEQALALRREAGDRRGIGSSLIDIGVFHGARGRYDDALKYYKEALQIQRAVGNVDFEALCLNNIGNIYLFKGQYDDAVTYFRLSLELRERSQDVPGTALTLHNLGEAYSKMGQFDESQAHYLRSLAVWRQADERRSAAMELHYLATVFEYQGRHGAAINGREEALKMLRDLGDRTVFLAGVSSGYGRVLNQVGRFDDATRNLEDGLTLARQLKHQALIARTLNYQAEGALYRDDPRSARKLLEEALPIAEGTKNSELIVLTKLNLAKVTVAEGKPQQAASMLKGLPHEAEAGGLKYIAADASLSLGEALLALRQVPQAAAQFRQVLDQSRKLGMPPLEARSHALLAQALRTGDQAAGARHAAEARRIFDAMRKEVPTGDLLKRADIHALYAALE
jgi:tetratricopeptide (TPR) repeat protein